MARERTKIPGVYQRISSKRMYKGKPDVCFDITYRANGRKVWEKVGWESEGYTIKLAQNVLGERTRSIRHGEELPQKKRVPTFKELAEKYLAWAQENKRSYKNDVTRYTLHLSPKLDRQTLREISSFDLERLKSNLSKTLSPATVKHCLVLVRQMYNKAIVWGMYSGANPVKGVKLPKLQNGRERFLSHDEARSLLSELSGDLRDMALLSLYTGMRAGEIFNLRGHDVDTRHGVITILDAKNGDARKANVTNGCLDMLKARKAALKPSERVFTQANGKPYKEIPKSYRIKVDGLFNKGVKDARQRVTFHTLRHTFGSWLAMQGESLLTIRELMGHKSFAMTQRYAHLSPDHKRDAVLKLDEAFTQAAKPMLSMVSNDYEGRR